ncbi:hypothetical protein [Nocardia sp. A7]|uniref:hypothetical protein n=1 Tax=Nocardia sp. A7 TaxID=2789274 RepID=UPI0039781795
MQNAAAGLDILVNNAGMTLMKGVDIMAPAELDTLVATTVRAPFPGARRFRPAP